ncbi:O-antigen ligase family protein [Acinetobacter haemolyticus]|uniref:O-antigen ligase family protein n=1 Tax=Acinetobacter haemolyticus TaxID=29430 RepID=UPI001298738C|nr:O-antigen ligase family protein [Acinetobacter haemolyticus]MQZ31559.1 O-antigen ligase family protein [Acinetobacter haemolyticus]
MDSLLRREKIQESIFYFFISLSFLYGILSFQHYSPSFHDFYIHTFVFFFCSIGTTIFFIKKEVNLYFNQFLWLILLFIFLIQPIFNHIIYMDGLIFPIAIIILMLFVSLAVSNLRFKDEFKKNIALTMVVGAILLQLTQFFHILKIESMIELMRLPLQISRFSGNLFQPNQAAFVFVLGVISVMYYFYDKKNTLLKYFLVFLLSLSVAFTASRTGLLMLLLGVLSFNILINSFLKVSLLKLNFGFYSILGLILGLFLYPYFSESGNVAERIISGVDEPRLSLLHRTWLIILDHPLLGGGWKSFASFGTEYFNKLAWFDTTDHSHFVFGQLLAEFGLLGLFCIFLLLYLFIKNIKIKNIEQSYVLAILLVILLYSFFEFPLWQLRYLLIFAVFLSLYDSYDRKYYTIKKWYLISFILFLLSIFSLYYSFQYNKIAQVYNIVLDESISHEGKKKEVLDIDYIYGFGYFNDLLVYEVVSNDDSDLNKKIEIGNRLVRYTPSYYYLIKHATFLALIGNTYSANYYFNASCNYAYGRYCEKTKKYLGELSKSNPDKFNDIYLVDENKHEN